MNYLKFLLCALILPLSVELNGAEVDAAPIMRSQSLLAEPWTGRFEKPGRQSVLMRTRYFSTSNQPSYRKEASSSISSIHLISRGHAGLMMAGQTQWDVDVSYAGQEQTFYPFVRDLSWGRSSSGWSIYAGRLKQNWFEGEELWQLGLYEPRYMVDKSAVELMGLTGLFVHRQERWLDWKVGFLPVYFPDMAPRFSVVDSQFQSKNPWFRPPAAHFSFQGTRSEIDYRVVKPEIEEVVWSPGAMGQLIGSGEDFTVRATYAYKPSPYLFLSFPYQLTLADTDSRLDVAVHPSVQYHQVISVDGAFRVGRQLSWHGGFAHEKTDSVDRPSSWMSKSLKDTWLGNVSLRWARENWTAELGWLQVWGGDAQDRGELSMPISFFERRYFFLEAFQARLSHEVGEHWSFEGNIIYDQAQRGGLVRTRGSYLVSRELTVGLGYTGIGLLAGSGSARVQDGFVYLYRANDFISMELNYDF